MNKIFNFFIAAVTLVAVSSCSSDDEPGRNVDYGKLRISHMNLSGAVSLGIGKNGSRAIDGEILSAGLYKIDQDGNIAAVGVYFTTDSLGNRLEHEEVLRVAPTRLYKLCDNFMLASECVYYDVEGDVVADKWETIDEERGEYRLIPQAVPYSNLLIRISDGKIWCVDNVSSIMFRREAGTLTLKSSYYTLDSKGNLYFAVGGEDSRTHCYKFDLSDNQPSLQQIDKGQGLSGLANKYFKVLEHDVIYSNDGSRTYFLWPNGGFQEIEYSRDVFYEEYRNSTYGGWYQKLLYNAEHGPVLITSAAVYEYHYLHKQWDDAARFYRYNIGAEPGSVTLTEPIVLLKNNEKYQFFPESVFETDDCFLISGTVDNTFYITRLDKTSDEWEWIKQTDQLFTFGDSNIYQRKAWLIKSNDELGAQWFDLETYEFGFVKFNILLPDYIHPRGYDNDIDKGYITYSGINPSDGNKTIVKVDITTGEAIWDIDEPSRVFEYIISLN